MLNLCTLIDRNFVLYIPSRSKVAGPGLKAWIFMLLSVKETLYDFAIFIIGADLNFLIIGVSYCPGPGIFDNGLKGSNFPRQENPLYLSLFKSINDFLSYDPATSIIKYVLESFIQLKNQFYEFVCPAYICFHLRSSY